MDVCRRSGHKVTHQRLEIFREVAATDEHPDVETIHERVRRRLPTVSIDTVYRTLRLLVDLGLASTVLTDQERMRYDANTNPHHHFVCTYVVTVAILIAAYLLLRNPLLSLTLTVAGALTIILAFSYYISVAKDLPFWRRFSEMAGLSLGVATLSFAVGHLLRVVVGVDV